MKEDRQKIMKWKRKIDGHDMVWMFCGSNNIRFKQ